MNHFNSFEEMYHFLREKPVEPERYVREAVETHEEKEEVPKMDITPVDEVLKPKRRKKSGTVLQAD